MRVANMSGRMPWEKSNHADRGKDAERKLWEALEPFGKRTNTAAFRLPDHRSGSLQPTLADFILTHRGVTYLLEAKETLHEYRLPHGNFSVDQVARMRVFKMAGMQAKVFIYHKKLDKWRYIDLDFFIKREGGSWVLSEFPLQDLSDILKAGDDPTSPLFSEPPTFVEYKNATS